MKIVRYVLTLLLCSALCISLLPTTSAEGSWSFLSSNASYSEVTQKVEQYINILNIGNTSTSKVYWNKALTPKQLFEYTKTASFSNTVSNSPCVGNRHANTHTRNASVNGTPGCTSNRMEGRGVSNGISQCWGFADYMAYVVFGELSLKCAYESDDTIGENYDYPTDRFTKITSFAPDFQFHPGDVIRYDGHHSVFIYKVDNDTLYYIDCNSINNCQLACQTTSVSKMKSRSLALWRLPLSSTSSQTQDYLSQCTSEPCNDTLTVKIEGNMKNMPYSENNNPQSETVEKLTFGNTYLSFTRWTNLQGEIWYETTSTGGQRGFIYFGDVSVSKTPSTLSVSGYEGNPGTPTGTLAPGSNFGLRGIISSNYNITQIEAHIFYASGGDAGKDALSAYSTAWNSKSYNIQTNGINNHFSFRNLESDKEYRYVVAATDEFEPVSHILIDSRFTVGTSPTEQKTILDLNGWLDGNLSWGDIGGYGVADIYINDNLAASGVSDYCTDFPVGTKYEIKNIRALDGHCYDGVHSGSLSGTIGTERVEVFLAFSKLAYLNLDGMLDGIANDGLGRHGIADVYINGNLVASDRNDYFESWTPGTTYEIKNIRAKEGYHYDGVYSESLSGTIGNEQVNVVLSFSTLQFLNLDGFLDGIESETLGNYGIADVYINGDLVAEGWKDYWGAWPTGTTYEIKNIRANPGYRYDGVYSGSLSGTIGTERVNVVLSFSIDTSTSGTCGDNVTWRLEERTLTIEGTGEMYNYYYYPPWYDSRSSIETVIIKPGVTTIGDDTCHYCSNLVSVSIPDTVTSIGVSAFSECSSLASISIPENVTRIDDYAFYYCESLTSIHIPENVRFIGEWAFIGCKNLVSVSIPDGVDYIGTHAFCGCSNLTSIIIPAHVSSIGEYTFSGCSSLESITIPCGMTTIDNHAFDSCGSLKDVYYTGTEDQWNQIGIGSCNECLTSATIHYEGNDVQPDFILPASLTEIGEEAFTGCSFTFVKLSEKTTTIGRFAFTDCPNLKYIYIPAATTSIDRYAFAEVVGLTIYGESGSAAETFANARGYTFVAVE